MPVGPGYQLETTDDEIIVRIRRDLIDPAHVDRFLAYVELASIRHRSRLTEDAATEFVDGIDRAVWEKNRHRVS